jgi:hypothetical protein
MPRAVANFLTVPTSWSGDFASVGWVIPLRRYLGVLSLLLVPACGQSDGVADVLLVATVEVTPPSASIGPQETLQLTAIPKTSGGLELPAREVTWSSSAPGIVSVSTTGMARALAVGGPVTVRATVDGVEGTAAISVSPVAVARVSVTPNPVNLSAGGTMQLTATAYDAAGGALPGRSFFWESSAPAIAPVTTGGLVIAQADGGPVIITASTGGRSGTTSVSVAPRPATRLGFLQQPTSTLQGHVIVPAIRVAIQDDLLHTVTSATNSVTIALATNPSGATLAGTTTVTAVGGIATFNDLSVNRNATGYTLFATATGLSAAISAPFDVNGVPAKVQITTQPAGSAQSGVQLTRQPAVVVTDASTNPIAGVTVTAAIASGSGTLGGTTTATTAANGIAAFQDLVIRGTVGTFKLSFTAPGAPAVTSANISLAAGPASRLTITTQPPSTALVGVVFVRWPVIQVRDAEGNAVNKSGIPVTAAIATGPSGGTLGGTLTVNTSSSGAATFSNLKLGKAGSYTLIFSSAGLTSVVSSTIVVN